MRQAVEDFGGQAARFGAEQKHVARFEGHLVGAGAAFGGEREDAAAGERGQALGVAFVDADAGELVIIEPCAFHFGRIEREAERLDQMQIRAGVGAQPDDVAGVRGDFRLL